MREIPEKGLPHLEEFATGARPITIESDCPECGEIVSIAVAPTKPADQLKAIDIAAKFGLPKDAYDQDLINELWDATEGALPQLDAAVIHKFKKAWVPRTRAQADGGRMIDHAAVSLSRPSVQPSHRNYVVVRRDPRRSALHFPCQRVTPHRPRRRRSCPVRPAELISIAFFGAFVVAGVVVPLPRARRVKAIGIGAAGILIAWLLSRLEALPGGPVARDFTALNNHVHMALNFPIMAGHRASGPRRP